MIYNCMRVINDNEECCGYLMAENVMSPLAAELKYIPIDLYPETVKDQQELFVLLSDSMTDRYHYTKTTPDTEDCYEGTYLTITEDMLQKAFSKTYAVVMIPQAVWRCRRQIVVMITFIGNTVSEFANYINRYYPDILEYSSSVHGNTFRIMCEVNTLFHKIIPKAPNILLPCTWSLFNLDIQIKAKNVANSWFKPADESVYLELCTSFEEAGEAYILPDLEDYPHIRGYQLLMDFTNEDMAVKLYQLMKLYKTPTLGELDKVLRSVV